MKKLFITALFALLMGGFTFTANAQPGKLSTPQESKDQPGAKYQQTVKDYQTAVDQFVKDFEALKEGKSTDKIDIKADIKAAKDLRKTLESTEAQKELTPKQKETIKTITQRFEEAMENYNAFLKK